MNNFIVKESSKNVLDILNINGYSITSDLNYCTENGIDYYIGHNGNKAVVVAIVETEDKFFITKQELLEMNITAKTYGIESVELFTDYGIELHSSDTIEMVGFSKITKII